MDRLPLIITKLQRSTYIAIAFVVVLTVVLIVLTPDYFWQGYLSNALATIVGILVGVPITLWVTSLQEEETEKQRKTKILRLLNDELDYNLELLHNTKIQNIKTLLALHVSIKTEVWEAFSDGGELQWIKDPELLGKISNAFFNLNSLRRWTDANVYGHFAGLEGETLISEKMSACKEDIIKTLFSIGSAVAPRRRQE